MAEPLQIPDDVTLDGLDGVPEALHGLFSETEDGKFALRAVPKTELSRFRDKNIQDMKERDQLQEQINKISEVLPDLDPEKAKQWRAERDELQEKLDAQSVNKEPEELEELVAKKTEAMRKDLEHRLQQEQEKAKKAAEEAEQWKSSFSATARENGIAMAANTVKGFRKEALPDAMAMAEKVWLPDPENPKKLIPKRPDGSTIYGTNTDEPISMKEWLDGLRSEDGRPHWFHATADGGGASGNNASTSNNKLTVQRSTFEAWTPAKRQEFVQKGGKLTD